MLKTQENYLSMCVTTDDYCTENSTTLATVPALVLAHDRLKDNINVVKAYQAVSENDISGWTTSKGSLKTNMIDKTLKLVNGIGAYALDKNDSVLYNEVNYSRSKLESMRDEEVDVKCNLINEKGVAVGVALFVDYGLAAADFTAQEAAVTSYVAVKQKPSGKSDERETARDNITTTIGIIRKDFELMDRLVKTLAETKPDFVTGYFKAREIYDIGVRHEPEEPTP